MRWLPTALALSSTVTAITAQDALTNSRQCLVVITPSWSAPNGTMHLYERGSAGWQHHGQAIAVVVGRQGLAWGRSLGGTAGVSGPRKREGDNKSPAGIFRLGPVFGRTQLKPSTKMQYIGLTQTSVCVNDSASRHYNQLIDAANFKVPDWQSSEKMLIGDIRYKWGVFVEHNSPPRPSAGSCIFLHVWKNAQTPTTGCTAMAENHLLAIIRWLDPAQHPLLVQMPQPVYNKMRAKWKLPDLR